MSPALNPSLLPKVPVAAERPAGDADDRLPVPQALMVIVLLASLSWVALGALVAWLAG
jgi:hypothetical protein